MGPKDLRYKGRSHVVWRYLLRGVSGYRTSWALLGKSLSDASISSRKGSAVAQSSISG